MIKILTTFFLAFFFIDLESQGYQRPPNVTEKVWESLEPYFLPYDSKTRNTLDSLFSKQRLLKSREKIIKAGFLVISSEEHRIVVAKHNKLKGYVIKAYLDNDSIDEIYWLKRRAEGARLINQEIIKHGYQRIMKAPKKWLYPLPLNPKSDAKDLGKYFVLVCEEMDTLSYKDSKKLYRKAPKSTVEALYVMITQCLLIDSVFGDNTIFCQDKRLAFLDTEHFMTLELPIELDRLTDYFSPEMQTYWKHLMTHGLEIH